MPRWRVSRLRTARQATSTVQPSPASAVPRASARRPRASASGAKRSTTSSTRAAVRDHGSRSLRGGPPHRFDPLDLVRRLGLDRGGAAEPVGRGTEIALGLSAASERVERRGVGAVERQRRPGSTPRRVEVTQREGDHRKVAVSPSQHKGVRPL